MLTPAAACAALLMIGDRLRPGFMWSVSLAALALARPGVGVLVAVAAGFWVLVGRARAASVQASGGDVVLLADLLVLGLGAGLTLENAFREAVTDIPPSMGEEVRMVLRTARRSGMSVALASATGRGERLYRMAASAAESGATLAPAMEALAGELRHAEHSRSLAAARRLPVRLLLPLALLILPGFVLVVVGPALIGSLARLEVGW